MGDLYLFISIIGRTHFYHLLYPWTIRLPSSLVCSSLSLEVRLNSVSARTLKDYFTYLHVLKFTGNSQKKIYDASFILDEEDVVLILLINLVRIIFCAVAALLEESLIHFCHILNQVRERYIIFMVSLLSATESKFSVFLQVCNRHYFQFLLTVILTITLHTYNNNLYSSVNCSKNSQLKPLNSPIE